MWKFLIVINVIAKISIALFDAFSMCGRFVKYLAAS